ncbi:hypothetical protein VFPPC_07792 [Pochonia chlamydosporia 170]|uniref:Uncharacterized protein n=1 Tax=Pochonia chlamydosporia 170 TaxID=1380566 RepID=A0A179FLV4_METCM|nr:hypothetical protein VFPPC_07792 [Pochonia chlamydosporia 170]OAQ66210.1 hypothetical protein VFPPC_07792 [Pochonia chlamydosporia 170]
MERDKILVAFTLTYDKVRPQLNVLLDDVSNRWEGATDSTLPNELQDTICRVVEKEAARNSLSVPEMRSFVDQLKRAFQDMLRMQKEKNPHRPVQYESVIRRMKTEKPGRTKGS